MRAILAVVNKEGENATETAIAMLKMLAHKNEAFGIASSNRVKIERSIEMLQRQDISSPVVIGHVFSRLFAHDRPQPIKFEGGTLVFEGRVYPNAMEISDAEFVVQKLQNRREFAKNLIKEFDGFFAFAVAESERIAAGRDVVGAYPFYYGENRDFAALASERKALWKIGIKNVNSFPPGHVVFVNKNGFSFIAIKTLTYPKTKQIALDAAADKLQGLLQNSVKERVAKLKEVAVAFSGGIDSSIIAILAKNLGLDVHLVCVSLENQAETKYAREAAEELELPIHVCLYTEEEVKKILLKVLELIEEPDSLKASIGIPFYWISEKVAEMNFKVLLAGQGADELFGGYKRYVRDYLRFDSEKVRRTIFNDIRRMYETNLERDFKICSSHNIELRVPFATYKIAKFAAELPLELKLERKEDGLRKIVLRRVAENLELPQFIVDKPKKAIQYATGVNDILKKLAKKEGLSLKEYVQKIFQIAYKKMMKNE